MPIIPPIGNQGGTDKLEETKERDNVFGKREGWGGLVNVYEERLEIGKKV
jgi:hypothetical protein